MSFPVKGSVHRYLIRGLGVGGTILLGLFLFAPLSAVAAATPQAGDASGLNPVANGVVDVAGAAALTALIVQQTKFLVELIVPQGSSVHDSVLRLYTNVVAILIVLAANYSLNKLSFQFQPIFDSVVLGFGVGLAAISGYHILNNFRPQTPPGTTTDDLKVTGNGTMPETTANGKVTADAGEGTLTLSTAHSTFTPVTPPSQ